MFRPCCKWITVLFSTILVACAGNRPDSLGPIKTFDPDNRDIAEPKEKEENQIWDLADYTFVYQVEKILDLNWSARKLGKMTRLTKGRQADNVNVLDEVPNSSWYTNRHYQQRMSLEALRKGPNVTEGPDASGKWTITRGKFEGGTPGFTIKDALGEYYILKFDASDFNEMGSSAEVISTKILHASGYNVPQNTIAYFNIDDLLIGETAQVVDGGFKRQMNRDDLQAMLKDIPRRADGKIRCLASKFVDGKPVGVWNFRGTRDDDPNDLVAHEHRRELRGLRTISSWLSDADRRAANTLSVYTEDPESGNRYIKHYIIDMGSSLGSNNKVPHKPKYGNEYLVDLRSIAKSFAALGFYVKPWEFDTRHLEPEFPSVGYYESEIFDPAAWFPTYPNPAFEKATLRDAFWGAKIVMNFRDDEIRAIVATAEMSDPQANEYYIRILIERRDKIGRYWFSQMNPLDRFRVHADDNILKLRFNDLAVDGNLVTAEDTQYDLTILHDGKVIGTRNNQPEPELLLSQNGNGLLEQKINALNHRSQEDFIFEIRIHTRRHSLPTNKAVRVFVFYPGSAEGARVVGLVREE